MKVEKETKYNVQSNISGRTVAGSIDSSQTGMIMDMFIRNYNEPHLAVLREYISNAVDSMKESGSDKPVEVTIPTAFSPIIKIQDFGLGMSAEDVENIYSKFLASTKREDNNNIGGKGIGGKSALAISDQFTVSAVKDGLRSVFVVSRVNGGLDYKFVIENAPCDDRNGVTVSIPVSESTVYESAALTRVLNGWKSSEVKVLNGDNFSRIADDWIEFENGYVNPGVFDKNHKWNYSSSAHVIVGTVAYSNYSVRGYDFDEQYYDNYDIHDLLRDSNFAIKVPIGSVTFPSSREVIENNKQNFSSVFEGAKSLREEFAEYAKKNYSKFSTLKEAIDFSWARQNSNTLKKALPSDVEFNGEPVPTSLLVPVSDKNFVYGQVKGINWIPLKTDFYVVENDTELRASSFSRYVNDYTKYGLNDSEALSSSSQRATLVLVNPEDITETMRELCEGIEKFSNIRESVLKARREEAKRKRESGEVKNDKADKKNTIMNRKVFTYSNREITLEKALHIKNEKEFKKVYLTRMYSNLEPGLKEEWDFDTNLIIKVEDRISEKSFNKYAEILNAEIIDLSEWSQSKIVEIIKEIAESDDAEDVKTMFKGHFDLNGVRTLERIESYKIEKSILPENEELRNHIFNIYVKAMKIEDWCISNEHVVKEIMGLSIEDRKTHEAFSLMRMMDMNGMMQLNADYPPYRYNDVKNIDAIVKQFNDYITEQAEKHLNFGN